MDDGFIDFARSNSCSPDFLCVHFYDNDFTGTNLNYHKPAQPGFTRLNRDENTFRKTLDQLHMHLQEIGFAIPVYLTEWNLTVSHRNLLNDTCFKSCYLCKHLLENYDSLDSFTYWMLTDFNEETQLNGNDFHGGLGLYTYSGIKKPHYYVFQYISRLGNALIARGEGYFITKSRGYIQIILYNYQHYNHLFASKENFDITFTKRYTPFSTVGLMYISVEFVEIPVNSCTIRVRSINHKSGSAFDEWVRMGGLSLTEQDIDI